MAKSARSKKIARNRQAMKKMTEQLRNRQLEAICAKAAAITGDAPPKVVKVSASAAPTPAAAPLPGDDEDDS